MRKLSPPYLRNLDLRTVNDAIIEIYRALNVISKSADEVTFRKAKNGSKELVINDNNKKYIDTSKNASFDANLKALKTKNINNLKKELSLDKVTNESKATILHNPTITGAVDGSEGKPVINTETSNKVILGFNANDEDFYLKLIGSGGAYDNGIQFFTGASAKWAMGYVQDSSTIFRINAGANLDADVLQLTDAGNLTIDGNLTAAETAASSETAKIAVLDSGAIKYRTAVQMQAEVKANLHIMTHNFDAAGTGAVYIPFGGSQMESAFTSDALDDETRFIAPFDGKLIRLIFQSASAGGATDALLRVNGTDGSGMTSTPIAGANTTVTLTINSSSNSFSAGDRLRVKFDPTNAPDEIAMTSVWEFTKT